MVARQSANCFPQLDRDQFIAAAAATAASRAHNRIQLHRMYGAQGLATMAVSLLLLLVNVAAKGCATASPLCTAILSHGLEFASV
jgi:hypothetical protein